MKMTGPSTGVTTPTLLTDKMPSGDHTGLMGKYPALVLNADYTPLSYVPLSLWSWQDTVRAVFRDAVIVLSTYEGVAVRSPSVTLPLPSVIVLKNYVPSSRRGRNRPVFTRRNLFLRDKFCCAYCRKTLLPSQLTYDHVVPRAHNGPTTWENVVTACPKCNVRKGSKALKDLPADMLRGSINPLEPTWHELQRNARLFPPKQVHDDWLIYLGGSDAPWSKPRGGDDEEDWGI